MIIFLYIFCNCCVKHDVDQKVLSGMLEHVVADCINFVGVDVNSCSAHMLKYVNFNRIIIIYILY